MKTKKKVFKPLEISAFEETEILNFKKLCVREWRAQKLWVNITPAFGRRLAELALANVGAPPEPPAADICEQSPDCPKHKPLRKSHNPKT